MSASLSELLRREGLLVEGDDVTIARAIERGLLGEDVLADLIAREAGSVVIDLDRGTVEREAIWLVPESLARTHLAVPVAVDANRTLSVAFADPLDRAGASAIAEATGRAVRALVGTLSSVRRALDREYGKPGEVSGPPTQVLPGTRRRSEPPRTEEIERESIPSAAPLAPESTQQLRATGTQPAHRIEQEASAAQRHEALLLALIERGVLTRADYAAALQRVLGRSEG
ncbi:MAG: hypothetical protein U0234_11145 [Sandaracinus sp.]